MKPNVFSAWKNLILLSLIASVLVVSASCSAEKGDETSLPQITPNREFTLQDAKELVERDRTATEIFVCSSLCNKGASQAVSHPVTSGEYSDYSAIKKLLRDTYTDDGDFWLSMPYFGEPPVSDKNGKTYVFYHPQNGYDDFINPDSVEVAETYTDLHREIKGVTTSGKQVVLDVVLSNGAWRLEQGIYRVNPKTEESVSEKEAPLSNYGSFAEFKGDILVIELYLSDVESTFNENEEAEFHSRISNAFDYISAQSKEYGNEVNITYESAYFHHGGVMGVRGLDFDIVFAETGFGTLNKFAGENFDLTAYDNYVFAVCLNKDAEVSYNCFDGSDETEIYFGERFLVGTQSKESEICVAALSLLGAYGYDNGRCASYTESLYRVYFPNDIMVSRDIKSSDMSPVTAYFCGITAKIDSDFIQFIYE